MDTELDPIARLALAPSRAYRELMYRPHGAAAQWIADRFDIVARPGQQITDRPRQGDVLLKVSLGHPKAGACTVIDQPDTGQRRMAPGQLLLRRRRAIREGPPPIEHDFGDETDAQTRTRVVVDAAAAVPAFEMNERSRIAEPLLTPRESASAVEWTNRVHPAISGVTVDETRTALASYTDATAVQSAIQARNQQDPAQAIDASSSTTNAVLVECVHQFQMKCYLESREHDGRAGESTLDSLGLIARQGSGLRTADRGNATAQQRLNSRDTPLKEASAQEFSAANWFNLMTDPSVFGLRTKGGRGLHVALVRKLRQAERHLLTLPAFRGMTPAALGTALGLSEKHGGARPTAATTSVHTFGLAIDIAYQRNPWVRRAASWQAMQRAASLISGVTLTHRSAPAYFSSLGSDPSLSTGEIWDELQQRNNELIAYLGFAADPQALRAALAAGHAHGTPALINGGESLHSAVVRWQRDIRQDRRTLAAGDFNGRQPERGFLTHPRDLAIALRDHGCLAWGAVDLGPGDRGSGDMMHYDARIDGVGGVLTQRTRAFLPAPGHPCLSLASTGVAEEAAFDAETIPEHVHWGEYETDDAEAFDEGATLAQTFGPLAEVEATRTVPVVISIPRGDAISFRTQSAHVGRSVVLVTGRLAMAGAATLVGEQLPTRGRAQWLRDRVREHAGKELTGAAPTGVGSTIQLDIGGHALTLELADAAGVAAFQVGGHWSRQGKQEQPVVESLRFASAEIVPTSITLDAWVWVAPDGQPTAGNPPTDEIVKAYTFLGQAARLEDERPGRAAKDDPHRTGAVITKRTLDELNLRLRDETKSNKYFRRFYARPEQQLAWLQQMRAYFGSDERTVEHLAGIRRVNFRQGGHASTWLHDDAAARLEAVEAALIARGEPMPRSGGVGWPRSEAELGGRQWGTWSLHNLGYAIDFNAYETPHLKGRRMRDLIAVVTGESPQMQLGDAHEAHIREMGDVAMSAEKTPEEKARYFADPRQLAFLDNIENEAKRLSAASEQFRRSLRVDGGAVDLAEQLRALRTEWFGARQQRLNALAKQTKGAERAVRQQERRISNLERRVDRARRPAQKDTLSKNVAAARDRLAKARAELTDLESERARLTAELQGEQGRTNAKWQGLQKEIKQTEQALKRARPAAKATHEQKLAELQEERRKLVTSLELDKILEPWLTKIRQEIYRLLANERSPAWRERVEVLETALTTDPAFTLGRRYEPVATDPSAGQVVTSGFFTTSEHSKRKTAFSPLFVRLMAKHGFKPGATFTSPDAMHFELRWQGPAQRKR